MAYEDKTYESILKEMLARLPSNLDTREGSLAYNFLAPAAAELQELYIQLDTILNETFVDTCSREYLLKRMSERGLYPNPATPAVLKCVINPSTISDSAIIKTPAVRFNISNLNYVVIPFDDPKTRDGLPNGTFKIQCETAGSVGNYPVGLLTIIDSEIEGMYSAEIPAADQVLIYGDDEEETESCRDKYYASLNTTQFGGNIEDYKNKIKDRTLMGGIAVGAVKVLPNTDASGNSGVGGHVKILILDPKYDLATPELLADVQEKIDPVENAGDGMGIAPIGHIVHIDTTSEETVYLNIEGALPSGKQWGDVKNLITNEINDYLASVRSKWEDSTELSLISGQLYSPIELLGIFETLSDVYFTDSTHTQHYSTHTLETNKIPKYITSEDINFTSGV